MKANDFNSKITSNTLKENLNKMFGVNVNLEKYSREQLEDMRNKLRTRVFQQEGAAGVNDLLTNETYQKDKAMLDLLNTRIKEMLGEDIKKLKDKMVELSEAKKGVRAPKYTKKAKGAKADKDYDGDGKIESPKDEVWGSRAKAAAKSGKPFEEQVEEGWDDMIAANKKKAAEKGTGKFDKKEIKPGVTQYTRKSSTFSDGGDDKDVKAAKKKTKAAAEGKDEGKPGKNFAKIAKSAGKRYGSKEAGERVAGAVRQKLKKAGKLEESNFKKAVRAVNEGLQRFIMEDEEGKAKAITAAGDMVNDYTSWMQRVGQYQTKSMIELADAIRADFGAAEAEAFKEAVGPALQSTLEVLTQQREAISNAVAVLAGEQPVEQPMGMEPEMMPSPEMDVAAPDEMNAEPTGDEFGATDAAAGAGTTGREVRESKFARKLAESHNIIAKLSK